MIRDEIQVIKEKMSDPLWRLNHLYSIVDKQGQRLQFKLNWAQTQLYQNMHYCNLILKCRQVGISTFVCLLFLDRCLFNSNTSSGIIAHTREDVQQMFKRIKTAYDWLPEEIREQRTANVDSAQELVFNNGSSIRVGTSMRGSTFQYLHISEYGKICSKYPEKAKEISTGSLNTIAAGQHIFIESTAEGRSGNFYDMCKEAQAQKDSKHKLSKLDFKFFFFPWWQHDDYQLDPTYVGISTDLKDYFESLKTDHKIILTPAQMAWYSSKSKTQGESMMQEYPSTPDEAFFTSNEGLYYGRHMAKARIEGRLRKVYHDPNLSTHVALDLGFNDATAIWFFQVINQEIRLIDYYERNGEPLTHFLKYIKDKPYAVTNYFVPHDAASHEYSTGISRVEVAAKHGISFTVLPRSDVIDGINAVRNMLDRCYFDEVKCEIGIKSLESYTKRWNTSYGGWDEKPLHNGASNGADAFRYLAASLDYVTGTGYSLEKHRELKRKYGLVDREQPNQTYLGY